MISQQNRNNITFRTFLVDPENRSELIRCLRFCLLMTITPLLIFGVGIAANISSINIMICIFSAYFLYGLIICAETSNYTKIFNRTKLLTVRATPIEENLEV